ncbi:MAG: pitrilysin family protein [Candidatus Neomarinimicrobiota bacterium]
MKYIPRLICLGLVTIAGISSLLALDESRVKEYTLDNGLKVITYEMHNAPVIYSQLTYNVGSKYEPFGQTGISHIVEHMMFKGTDRFPKGTISELISANGGIYNAYTSSDITVYYELLPKNIIDLAFDIESERMYKCAFDPAEFQSEINVIAEERKQRTENSAAGIRREELNTLLYKNHPYRNPVIGWMNDIRNAKRDDAYKYYRTYYTPNNATLVLTGDFETAAILKKVKSYFGKIPRGPELPAMSFYRVSQTGKKTLDFVHSDILNESIQYYFEAPTRFEADGPALYVAGQVLGARSSTSRLNKKLHREKRVCESATAGLSFTKDPSTFNLTASLMPTTKISEVEALIQREIDSLATTPVLEYDLQKIKNRIIYNELTSNQHNDEIGGLIGTYDNFFNWHYINQWNQLVMAVTPDDVMRVVNKYLKTNNFVASYSHPDTTARSRREPIDEEEENETLVPITEPEQIIETKDTVLNPEVRQIYFPKLEEVISPNPISPLIAIVKLKNGIPVYLLENHDFQTIMLIGNIETGRMEEENLHPGIRQMTVGLIARGTTNRKYEDLLEERSFTPYSFDLSQSWNKIVFQGYGLSKDFDKILKANFEIVTQPIFPESEIEKVRPSLIKSAREYKETDRMKAFYTMYEKVFEGHQYSLPYAGDPETFNTMTSQDLRNFHAKYYSPDNLSLMVVGDFNKKEIVAKLNETYGQWKHKSGDPHLAFQKAKAIKGKTVYVFGNPEYKQCRVDLAINPIEGGIKVDNPDIQTLKLLESILCGSSLTSRMGKELRDKQGLSYGIKSNLWIRDQGGYWNIRTELDKANLSKMIHGIFNEIDKVQKYGVTDEELEKAKARSIAMLSMNTRTPDEIGLIIFDLIQNKQPLDYFDQSKQRILAITKADIQRAANKYLNTDNYILAVSGDIAPDALDEFK